MLDTYAEGIKGLLNKYAYCWQDNKEFIGKYDNYRRRISDVRDLAKKYLDVDLPELPELIDNDYNSVMDRLMGWCRKYKDTGKKLSMAKMVQHFKEQDKDLTFSKCCKLVYTALEIQGGRPVKKQSISNEFNRKI